MKYNEFYTECDDVYYVSINGHIVPIIADIR